MKKASLMAASACLVILGSGFGTRAYAQTDTADPAEAEGSKSGLEEIIVTAQRRSESLQDVPIAITAVTSEALSSGGVGSMQALDQLTPGLVSTVSAGIPQRYLRGVGGQVVALYEQPVATFVDGVYIASSSASLFSFNNIERIEVLRGPQGTLFGRNATGGVIHVITKEPNQDPEADLLLSYGSYQTVEMSGYANAGLGEGVAVNVAAYFRDQGKGYGHNLANGKEINFQDDFAVRGQLLIEPTATLSLRYSGDYTRQESDIGLGRQVLLGSRNGFGDTRAGGIQDGNFDFGPEGRNSQWGVSQNAVLDVGGASLRSITAYRKFKFFALYDLDTTPLYVLNARRVEDGSTFQQEFLLEGETGNLKYTAGFFYLNLKNIQRPVATFGAPGPGNIDRFSVQETNSYAAYAQFTYALTDALNLSAGARYTIDETSIDGQFVSTTGFPGGAGQVVARADSSFRVEKPTWRFAVDYKLTPDILAYGSVSRGFKSGAYNNSSITAEPTRPEILDAYELGLKTELLDRSVRFNVTSFLYDYKDLQIGAISLPNVLLVNAATAKVKGLEFELAAAPKLGEGTLNVASTLALLDAKYKSFPNAPYFLPNPFTSVPPGFTCTVPSSAAVGGNTPCSFDASGKRMIRAPKATVNFALGYEYPLGDGAVGFNANYFYNSGFVWEVSNRTKQGHYEVVNGEIFVKMPDNGPRLSFFVKNLTDTEYYSSVSEAAAGDVATPLPPRTFGVRLQMSFGGR